MVSQSKLVLPVLPRLRNACHGNIRAEVSGTILFCFPALVLPSIPGIVAIVYT